MIRCVMCHAEAAHWSARCPGCGRWNSLQGDGVVHRTDGRKSQPSTQVLTEPVVRLPSHLPAFDRALRGGLVRGKVTFFTGWASAGKSTGSVQLGGAIAKSGHTVLYATGDDDAAAVVAQAARCGVQTESLHVLQEYDTDALLREVDALSPALVVVDDVQHFTTRKLDGGAGSPGQLVYLFREAKLRARGPLRIAWLMLGEVTKTGSPAGPEALAHEIDAELFLDVEDARIEEDGRRVIDQSTVRLLRPSKNRQGSGDVVRLTMTDAGLVEALPKSGGVVLPFPR